MAALADTVTPAGGWAAYGAAHTALDLVADPDLNSPAYRALMDGAIEVLRRHGIPPKWVPDPAWDRWADRGGTLGTWLPQRPPPTEDDAPISPLANGETRPIARLTSAPDSNILLVDQVRDGTYSAVIDARRDDSNPRRSRWEWRSAPSLYQLYLDVGRIWQVPPYWCDPELAPFFPLPKPSV